MTSLSDTTTLTAALIQTDLVWEDVTANLANLEEKISALDEVDVIVLPEMFNTAFTMNTSVAEPMNFTTTRWMRQMAELKQALVIGSFAAKQGDQFFNRLVCMKPDGSFQFSDKRHLFRMGGENEAYTPGDVRLIVEWKLWRICPLVCYDLRFPVWSRNNASDPYDVLVYVANWPAKRAYAWNTLLRARAIENQAYVLGVNRVGVDGKQIHYQGDSAALDYLGEPLLMLADAEGEKVVRLSREDLDKYRLAFPALTDADGFELQR
ncbi:amidohydrolase [Dyadobacter sandarakinus]|uniref:Amidohydrolase n=1 Tax=Dyadobacter sandarakinus TaxID=2747268 RepID=A0ABX7I9W5_9BACT|nr:amidohydrolase [Dyadobacter sandarakinus]QRR02603.1 amidohydrolase [Dyadobacter sandarakinus]